METAQLYQSLTFLAYATGIIVIVVGVMLVKVLVEVSRLAKNLDETTTIVRTELEPTLKNINKSVTIVSGIIIKTDEGINKVRNFISKTPLKLFGQVSSFAGKATGGFFKGMCSAFKMFSKR